jgi:Uncharacterized protein conserved in bacteria
MEAEELRDYYGCALPELCRVRDALVSWAKELRGGSGNGERGLLEHCEARIKSPESARAKLRRAGFAEGADTALQELHDLVGVRLVCTFPDSVYQVAERLRAQFDVTEIKDYIRTPKPNGYRSLHLILRFSAGTEGQTRPLYAEVQLRTIAMDCWASLEHQLKYKRTVRDQALIVGELKRCADELASADLMMQTIQELIDASGPEADRKEEELT